MLTVSKLIPQGQGPAVFLPRVGDVLVAEDGALVRVLTAPQALLRITRFIDFGLTGQGPQIAANPVSEFRLGRTT